MITITSSYLTKDKCIVGISASLDTAILITAVVLTILYRTVPLAHWPALGIVIADLLIIVGIATRTCCKKKSSIASVPSFLTLSKKNSSTNKIYEKTANAMLDSISKNEMSQELMIKILGHIEWMVQKRLEDDFDIYKLEEKNEILILRKYAETQVIGTLEKIKAQGVSFAEAVDAFTKVREKTEAILKKKQEIMLYETQHVRENASELVKKYYPLTIPQAIDQASQIILKAYELVKDKGLVIEEALLKANQMEAEARSYDSEWCMIPIVEFEYAFNHIVLRTTLIDQGMETKSAEIVATCVREQREKRSAGDAFDLEDALSQGKIIEEECRFFDSLVPLYEKKRGVIILGHAESCREFYQEMINEGITSSCAKIRARTTMAIMLLNIYEKRALRNDSIYTRALEQKWRELSQVTDEKLCNEICARIRAHLDKSYLESSPLHDLYKQALREVPYQKGKKS